MTEENDDKDDDDHKLISQPSSGDAMGQVPRPTPENDPLQEIVTLRPEGHANT